MILEIATTVTVFIFVVAYSHMLTIMNRDRFLETED